MSVGQDAVVGEVMNEAGGVAVAVDDHVAARAAYSLLEEVDVVVAVDSQEAWTIVYYLASSLAAFVGAEDVVVGTAEGT